MILYFGNVLSSKGNNPSFIELLAPKLGEFDEVKISSSARLQVIRLLQMILTLLKYQRRTKLILLDTYSYRGFYYAFVIGLLSWFLKKPYFPIIRGGDFASRMKNTPRLAHALLERAEMIIVPSAFLSHMMKENGYGCKIIPNFLNISEYSFKPRDVLRNRILWVRSFHMIYQPDLAVRIASKLLQKFPDTRLCMVGPDKDGSLEKCKTLARELGIADHVEFTGYLPKREWHQLSEDYDIFLNTTSIDNQPVSVLEAMALGLTVVSSNVGGIPFLIEHERNGLLTQADNIDSFTESITRLLSDDKLARLLQTNARKKAEMHDWSFIKTLWSELLSSYLK